MKKKNMKSINHKTCVTSLVKHEEDGEKIANGIA